ncbi:MULTISPECIES: SulP family inorganic anion transporter [unclassified Frankia]|uniref:SulP family inorganic anion transporter n=1 Tax=Frankia sp. R43 TaxID=269536 RepID=UPI0018E978E6
MNTGLTSQAVSLRALPYRYELAAYRYRPTQNLLAGVIVAVVALPPAWGLGVASGAGASAGLIAAIVAGAIAAKTGTDREMQRRARDRHSGFVARVHGRAPADGVGRDIVENASGRAQTDVGTSGCPAHLLFVDHASADDLVGGFNGERVCLPGAEAAPPAEAGQGAGCAARSRGCLYVGWRGRRPGSRPGRRRRCRPSWRGPGGPLRPASRR